MQIVKIVFILLSLTLVLFAKDIVVYENEYKILKLQNKIKKLIIGNKEILNVSLLNASANTTHLKLFGKESGNTSILIINRDGSYDNYHVYINQNLGYLQKMINVIEPNIYLSRVGNGSVIISGEFKDPHQKKRIYSILNHSGVDMTKLMDVTKTLTVNKMIRTKLYMVEINNQKAKDIGGVTGLGFLTENANIVVNPGATAGATFSGFLLDNTGVLTGAKGKSLSSNLNFLESKGVAKILDDTVLITTEDQNATFHVGGDVYIPTGMTQNAGLAPTIQLTEKEYGLRLTLSTSFLEQDNFMHVFVDIEDSEFDENKEHYVKLGPDIFVPSFISKNIKTDIVAKSGHIIVLGGRLHTEDVQREEKVPFLGDIPLLGELFKRNVSGTKENDLLFFLIPEIIDSNEKVDDSEFYADFKKSSTLFHKEILETNSSKKSPQSTPIIVEPLEVDDISEIEIIDEHSSASETIYENDDSFTPKEVLKIEKNLQYKIANVSKIFIRDNHTDGAKVDVWKDGHKFIAKREKIISGTTWIEIEKDCYKECLEVSKEMWIPKRYTEVI